MSNKKVNASSQILADFTISRIDSKIRRSMSTEQLNAVREALLASNQQNRHAMDWRFTIPLFFANYYVVFLAGRDKRRKTVLQELQRSQKGNVPLAILLSFIAFIVLAGLIWGGVIVALYWMKSDAGIDIFSNFHFGDLFK